MNGNMLRALAKMKEIEDLPTWVEMKEDYHVTIIPPGELFSKAVIELSEEKVVLQHLDGPMFTDGRDVYTPENLEWDEIIAKIADPENPPVNLIS